MCNIDQIIVEPCLRNVIYKPIQVNASVQSFDYPILNFSAMTKVISGITVSNIISAVTDPSFLKTAIFTNNEDTTFDTMLLTLSANNLESNLYVTDPLPSGVVNLDEKGSGGTIVVSVASNHESFKRNKLRYGFYKLIDDEFSELIYERDLIKQIEFGEEMILNGGFDDNDDNWTGDTSTDEANQWVFTGGTASLNLFTTTTVQFLTQALTIPVGSFALELDISNFKSAYPLYVGIVFFSHSESLREYYFKNIFLNSSPNRYWFPVSSNYITQDYSQQLIGNGKYRYDFDILESGGSMVIAVTNTILTLDNITLKQQLTGNTYNDDTSWLELEEIPIGQGEYIVKPSYVFYGNSMPSGYKRRYDTKDSFLLEDNLTYGLYNETFDWYFVAVENPEEPEFLITQELVDDEVELLSEVLDVVANGQTLFTLKKLPTNFISLFLNASALFPAVDINGLEDDIRAKNNPFVNCCPEAEYYVHENKVYINDTLVLIQTGDTVVANYNIEDADVKFRKEGIYITDEIISASTNTTRQKIFFNTNKNKYEYYLDRGFTDIENMTFFKNGSVLAPNVDFFGCEENTVVVFDTHYFITGDTIQTSYEGIEDILTTISGVTLSWTTTQKTDKGLYVVQISEVSDYSFTGWTAYDVLSYSGETGQLQTYESTILFPIDPNLGYKARVFNVQAYTTLDETEILSANYNDPLFFRAINKSVITCPD